MVILEWGTWGRGKPAEAEPGTWKEADEGKGLVGHRTLELVGFPSLQIAVLRFPLTSFFPALFLHPEPYARVSCVLIF